MNEVSACLSLDRIQQLVNVFSASSSSVILKEQHLSLSEESLCTETGIKIIWCVCHLRLGQQATFLSLKSSLRLPIGGWVVWSCPAVLDPVPVHKRPELGAGEWCTIVCHHCLGISMSSALLSPLVDSVSAGGRGYHSNLQPLRKGIHYHEEHVSLERTSGIKMNP